MTEQAESCDECDGGPVVVTVQGLGACAEHIDAVMSRVGVLMQALREIQNDPHHPSTGTMEQP